MLILPIMVAIASVNVSIHPNAPGVAVRHDPLGGVPLCVWNDSGLFSKLKRGIQEVGDHQFRYPNGSTSNQYHWNGQGHMTSDSVWVASDSAFSPGWLGRTLHTGTSKSNYANIFPSLIDDGDTSTYWWSNPDHKTDPGWFYMDLGVASRADSFALWLGRLRPDSVQILRWTGPEGIYPGPHQFPDGTKWVEVARVQAGPSIQVKTAATQSRYFAVRPVGSLDSGWQVREFQVLAAGHAVSSNVPDEAGQSKVTAITASPSALVLPSSYDWDFETYMAWIHAYPGAEPLICVNYGGGTAQEAAAWVHYANVVKHYGIHRWQIGNEMAGDWEDGGPTSARRYAERFVLYSRAMKAVDPTIWVNGPVIGSDQFTQNASGDFDGRSWMEGFLHYVDSVEQSDKIRLLDGVDFHTYPYWFDASPDPQTMIDSCDGSGAAYDTLKALIDRTLADRSFREVLMTEYNTSVVSASLEQTASAGTSTGLQLAHFIQRFGDRGLAVLWELSEGGGVGPDGTWGTLSEFDAPTRGEWSSLGFPPAATFWAKRTILRQWLDAAGGDTVMPVDQAPGARLFAVRNHGRVSILAFNLGPDSTAVSLDPSPFVSGDILSWGTGEYDWNGTDVDAQASPDNGPSSRPVPIGWSGSAKIPPYGFLVVRGAGRPKQAVHTGHWQLSRSNATVADSLTISGWSVAEGGRIAGGTWTAGNASGPLLPTDGSWDGPAESWSARIPAANIGIGTWTLRIAVADSNQDTARDSTPLVLTGALRPVVLVSNFDNGKPTTTFGAGYNWGTFAGPDSFSVTLAVPTTGGMGSPFLQATIHIAQPSDLGYTNYVSTYFRVPKGFNKSDSTRDLVGMVFDIKTHRGSSSQDFRLFLDQTNINVPGNYNNYGISLPNTQNLWVRDTVLFQDFHQGVGWGKILPLDLDSLQQMEFRTEGPGNALLSLDNVAFLGTRGNSYMVPLAPMAAHAADLAISGHRLEVGASGNWTLRLMSLDGRTVSRWKGTGPATLALPRTARSSFAILEGQNLHRKLTIPPDR